MATQLKPEILLSTLNSRYPHCSFGLRYLYAQLAENQAKTAILEFTINQDINRIAETILEINPTILGLGIYIWNARESLELVRLIKQLAPEICICLGGPEVSHEYNNQEIVQLADFLFVGEADEAFSRFVKEFQFNTKTRPNCSKIIHSPLPELKKLKLPYEYYTDEDLAHRILYVEASRGCPFKCEYCLSSLDEKVREFPLFSFLAELKKLTDRGARTFKFVDRTFNLKMSTCIAILDFFEPFAQSLSQPISLHFEMIPDRLPEEVKTRILKFPRGSIQFEVGIQTWNPEVADRVQRKQSYDKIIDNMRYLTTQTGVHIHADIIAGLPGEDLASFKKGFNAIAQLNTHEIQVGILKRLRGTPISSHTKEFQMIYQTEAPYRVLQTSLLSFSEIQKIDRFSRYWDRIANSGKFKTLMGLLREKSADLFSTFWSLTEFLDARHETAHSISLESLLESLYFFSQNIGIADEDNLRWIQEDYCAGPPKHDLPRFLKRHNTSLKEGDSESDNKRQRQRLSRQNKHHQT